jgi:hypothetical protein
MDNDPLGDYWWGFEIFEEANKRFTTAAIKEHLSRAAENARAFLDFNDMLQIAVVDRESITNIEIKLP